jgi:hypothetical protein
MRLQWRAVVAVVLAVGLAGVSGCSFGRPSGTRTPPGVDQPAGGPGGAGDGGGGTAAPKLCANSANLSPLGISVLVDRKQLVLPDGTPYTVDAVPGGPVSGYQTCDGWLVRGFGNGVDTLSLWLVSPTGALRPMVEKADAPVAVGPDGRRLAWRSGGKLYFGHVDPTSKAIVDRSSPAPDRGAPIAVGADSVVLGYSETGGGIDHHDVWFPGLGDYKPTWDKSADVRAVYAPALSDGTYLGLVQGPAGAKDTCLAVLNPKDNLKATKKACGIVTQIDRNGAVSADGHWLAMLGSSGITIVDLTKVFTTPAVATTWVAPDVGAWENATTMLVASTALGGALLRFTAGTTTAVKADRAGVTPTSSIALRPRLG